MESEEQRELAAPPDQQQQEEEEVGGVAGVDHINKLDVSVEKSSPFHGFSSQEESGLCTPPRPAPNTMMMKDKLIADFAIGLDNSEEDTETSDCDAAVETGKANAETGGKEFEISVAGIQGIPTINETDSKDIEEIMEVDSLNDIKDSNTEAIKDSETIAPDKKCHFGESAEQFATDSIDEKMEVNESESCAATEISAEVSKGEGTSEDCDVKEDEREDSSMIEEPEVKEEKAISEEVREKIIEEIETPEVYPVLQEAKVSPVKVATPSPVAHQKKVHFSPEVELKENSKVERSLLSEPKLNTNEASPSPPLKLKIKFGKDKSGTITHGKIKPRSSPAREAEHDIGQEEEPVVAVTASLDAPFHGWAEAAVPDWVPGDYSGFDLTASFAPKPTVFVSISSKAKKPAAAVEAEPAPGPSQIPSNATVPLSSRALPADLESATTPSTKTSKRKKSENLNFIKPLYDGWQREVVRGPGPDQCEVYYYPPGQAGQRKQRYRDTTQLEAHLITSGSCYPISFFTFKKETVGGPEGWELVRQLSSPEPGPPSAAAAGGPGVAGLGKRVSKPPPKLVMETQSEAESGVTPTRTSKRTSRAPDKLEPDYR